MSAISLRGAGVALGAISVLLGSCATVPGHEPAQRAAVAQESLGLDGAAVGSVAEPEGCLWPGSIGGNGR